mmetsp:Transcript_16267/g.38723  ORF Transcript_16267/g.38723 Transcript_16267/m.38723 type:complete len:205 (+) Transcript_16267:2333-2947(+)
MLPQLQQHLSELLLREPHVHVLLPPLVLLHRQRTHQIVARILKLSHLFLHVRDVAERRGHLAVVLPEDLAPQRLGLLMVLQRHCSVTQLVPDLPQLAQDPWHVLMFQLAMRGLEQRQRLRCMRQRLFELLLLEVSARRQVVSLRHLPAYTVLPAARMLPHCHNARRILEALNWLAVSVDEQQRMVEQRVRGQLPLVLLVQRFHI